MEFKARIYTLGCKVNQYESEAIREELERRGFSFASSEDGVDVCIINTCTVTAESDRKCRQMIRRAIASNPDAAIIVTGCYAQVNGEKIAAIKGVDFVCGNRNKLITVEKAVELAGKKLLEPVCAVESLEGAKFEDMAAARSERTRAYIKIEDGCENKCAYCIIPRARGKIRSKTPDKVVAEAKNMRNMGYRELVLTGIEVVGYGKDLEKGVDLPKIMELISENTGFERISLGSLEPSVLKKGFVDRLASIKGASRHFHLSLQSGCDRTLNAMKRKYNTKMVAENVDYIRSVMPDAAFTADIIVGFPGETQEDFENTCKFISSLNLLDAHVFAYSRRAGTVADKLPCQIDEGVKKLRSEKLISICREKKREVLEKMYKDTKDAVPVLFETYKNGILTGRMNNFAEVRVKSGTDLTCEIKSVRLTGAQADYLLGELV